MAEDTIESRSWEEILSSIISNKEDTIIPLWKTAEDFLFTETQYESEGVKKMAHDAGYASSTGIRYAKAARVFPADKRLPQLSFTHHLEAAEAPTPELAFAYLQQAADERLSTRKLKEIIKGAKGGEAKEEKICDACGSIIKPVKRTEILE